MNRDFDSSLRFEPDDNRKISRELRAELAARAILIAPPQPEGRPFEYVGFATGSMRQDLHQVMWLIDQGITSLHISLIDSEYGSPEKTFHSESWDSEHCLSEFQEVIRLRAPDVLFTIDLYRSAEEWSKAHQETPIDLLTAIRVAKSVPEINEGLELLEKKLAETSGSLICRDDNSTRVRCIRDGANVEIMEARANSGRSLEIRRIESGNLSNVFIKDPMKKRWDEARGA